MTVRWATRDTDRLDLCEIWIDKPSRHIRDNDYYWAGGRGYACRITDVQFKAIFGCLPRPDRPMRFCR